MPTSHIPVPRPSYTQARENLVKAIPPKILCLLACGGKDCRYEGPECWKANQQVIRGLFSSWWDAASVNTTALHQRAAHALLPPRVTDDIVAMARPSNHLIEKYRIVEQFQRLSVFNAAAAFRRLLSDRSHGWHFIFCLQAEHPISHQHAASRRTRSLRTQPGPRKWFHLLPAHLHGQWQWDLLLYPPVAVFDQNHVKSAFTCIWEYLDHKNYSWMCVFVYFQYIFTTLGCQIMECRPSLASLTGWKFWPLQWQKGGWPSTAMLVWAGQVLGASLLVVRKCCPATSACARCFPVRRPDRLLPGLHSPPQPQRGRPLRTDQAASLHPDAGADQPGVRLRSPARHAAGPVPGPEPAARSPIHPAALPESTGAAAARPGGTRAQIHAKGQDAALSRCFHAHSWQSCWTVSPDSQVVYLLCVRISCLALGLPSPPEVHAELEKRSALKALNRTVRETLVAKHYLPLLNESNKSSWVGSVTSWDDPLGCLERRRELLADKRSFSDSDLSKLKNREVWFSHYHFEHVNPKPDQTETIFPSYSPLKDTGWSPYSSPAMGRHWCVQDLMRADLKPVNSVRAAHSPDNQTTKKHPHPINFQMLSVRTSSRLTKRSKWALKKPLHKHSSSIEVVLSLAAMSTPRWLCYSVICVIYSCAGLSVIQTPPQWPAWWQRRWRTRVLRERLSCRDRLFCRWLVYGWFISPNLERLWLWLFYRRSWTVATAGGLCWSPSRTPKYSAASCGLGLIG